MKILLYAIFTNQYTTLLPLWLKYTATNFYPKNTDVLIVIDDAQLAKTLQNVKVKIIKSSQFRNEELWLKNERHLEILEEYKDEYDLFATIQANCFLKTEVNEHNFPLNPNKLTVFCHSLQHKMDILTSSCCKDSSCGYLPIEKYKNFYPHAGATFGCYDIMFKMNNECNNMYKIDKTNNVLHAVPFHDESYLATWIANNENLVTTLNPINMMSYQEFIKNDMNFVLVDKNDLGIMIKTAVIPIFNYDETPICDLLFLIAATYSHCLRNGFEMKFLNLNNVLYRLFDNKFTASQEWDVKSVKYSNFSNSFIPIPKGFYGLIQGNFFKLNYFSDYQYEIKQLFNKIKSTTKKHNTAAIFIKMNETNSFFIKESLKKLSPNITTLIVFSDDLQKALAFIKSCKEAKKYTIIKSDEFNTNDSIDELSLMTSCEELIVWCSNFSWWGAFLGDYNKVFMGNSQSYFENS